MAENQLPDDAPDGFKSWLDYYFYIRKALSESGQNFNDESEICNDRMFEIGKPIVKERYKMSSIKAKALDYVLENLPSFGVMWQARKEIYNSTQFLFHDEFDKLFDGLLNICPHEVPVLK